MTFETIFFDLDATLYAASTGLWEAIRVRIDQYLREVMDLPAAETPKIRQRYYEQHGTTLRGLQIDYGISARHYLDYVHDLPLHEYLQPDPDLRDLLLSIPCPRWIFTNSDEPHAQRVLSVLGIEACFDGLVDIYRLDPECKPRPGAYHKALALAGVADPKNCTFIDDAVHNLVPAKALGFFTVLISDNGTNPVADRSVKTIHEIRQAVPEFWQHV